MAKVVKARSDLGVNVIMDPVMVPDGFSRVCDGLDLRSGVARTWNLPTYHRPVVSLTTAFIWEYRGKWYESSLIRTYHGEYREAQEIIYFTEEGPDHVVPQKIVDGVQARLGTPRPLAPLTITSSSTRYPSIFNGVVSGAGAVQPPYASYRIAAMVGGKILSPSGAISIPIASGSTVVLNWRKVEGADGYAIFGRTANSERLLIKLGNTSTWTDTGGVSEGFETATSYTSSQSFQYVYTYYRKVGTVEDESGPSPVSVASPVGGTPVISRQVIYDGSYGFGGTVFNMSAHTLTAYSIANPYATLCYAVEHAPSNSTMHTSVAAHNLTTGMKGRLIWTPFSSIDFEVTIPTPLSPPGITLSAVDPYPAGGTVSVGAHTYKFTAVRGLTVALGMGSVSPAQTTETTVAVTVAGSPSSVRFAIGAMTSGTDAVIAYRDGTPVAMFDPWTVATWTDTGFPSIGVATIPATNETATRCFSLNGLNYVTASPFMPTPIFQVSRCDITLGSAPSFAPATGDILQFSGLSTLSALNGSCPVIAYDAISGKATLSRFMDLALNGTTDSGSGTMSWALGNGSYAGWRIYRVGDTSEFLRVADLGMDVETYTDLVSTDSLGVAIPTAYTSNGLEVVFDKAPDDLRRMVNHYGMRFGIDGDLVRWTPVDKPDAWPDVFFAAFPSKPVMLVSFRSILSVLCEDGLYGLVGNSPATMSPSGPYSNLGCIAPFSAVASNHGMLWLSKAGIAISTDGVSAYLLAPERTPGRYYYAPSTPGTGNYASYGQSWYIPATQTVQFAESMRNEAVNYSRYPVSQVSYDLPITEQMTDIRAVYWDDRYILYFSGSATHARSGCIVVDMSREAIPITTLPIKPVAMHVTLGGDLFMLLRPAPVTTVTITSPV